MKIIFLSPYPPLPVFHGAVRRIWSMALHLYRLGNDVTVICRSGESNTSHGVRIISCQDTSFLPHGLFKLGNINMTKELSRLLNQADIIQCEFPYSFLPAYFSKLFRKPIVLDEHGVESLHLQETSYPNVPSKKKQLVVHLIEKMALDSSDLIFSCSNIDAQAIHRLFKIPETKLSVIPNGVDIDYFKEGDPFNYHYPSVLFVGGSGHPPNAYAVNNLYHDIVPAVERQTNNAQFSIIGNSDGYPRSTKSFVVYGCVPDVRPYIWGSELCVAPIYQGTGTRLKVLEYMACKKPVVATRKAVEGIEGLKHNENIVFAESPVEFSNAIVDLLKDQKKRRQIGENGYQVIYERYNWLNICKNVVICYNRLLN